MNLPESTGGPEKPANGDTLEAQIRQQEKVLRAMKDVEGLAVLAAVKIRALGAPDLSQEDATMSVSFMHSAISALHGAIHRWMEADSVGLLMHAPPDLLGADGDEGPEEPGLGG